MLAEMNSYYDELTDHDVPPSGRGFGRKASIDRRSRTSELSLNLDDLEDLRIRRTSSHNDHRWGMMFGDCNDKNIANSSALSLSSWMQEPEPTTGNRLGGASLRNPSLGSVVEGSDDEIPCSNSMAQTTNDVDPGSSSSISCSDSRPRRQHSDDFESSLSLPSASESNIPSGGDSSCFGRSRSWDGILSCSVSKLGLMDDQNLDKPGKRVHFEAPARLEEIREFEKPDFQDYNDIYYMSHEIQKMIDDFKKESELERHVVR